VPFGEVRIDADCIESEGVHPPGVLEELSDLTLSDVVRVFFEILPLGERSALDRHPGS
jgi:hypothetical protein